MQSSYSILATKKKKTHIPEFEDSPVPGLHQSYHNMYIRVVNWLLVLGSTMEASSLGGLVQDLGCSRVWVGELDF